MIGNIIRQYFQRDRKINSFCPSKLCTPSLRDRASRVNQYNLRSRVSLLPWMSRVERQQYNDCTAEAVAGALEYLLKRYSGLSNGEDIDVSRLFIYWVAVMIESEEMDHQKDEGSYTPEAIYGLVKYGFCLEEIWPYSDENVRKRPPGKVWDLAKKITVIPLLIPPHLVSMKRCLNYDLPFVIAMKCVLFRMPDMIRINRNYNSSDIPQADGNHAVLVIGYDDRTQLFLVRNSWGIDWGFEGHFYIPYKYMIDNNFMNHDVNGIWAISDIKMRRNTLLRFNNPPHDPYNPFIPLPTNTNINLLDWFMRRFVQHGISDIKSGMNDTNNLYEQYLAFMQSQYPYKHRHHMRHLPR